MDLMAWFSDVDGILVPGGFGRRGSEGKISAIQYARINNVARNLSGDASETFCRVFAPCLHD